MNYFDSDITEWMAVIINKSFWKRTRIYIGKTSDVYNHEAKILLEKEVCSVLVQNDNVGRPWTHLLHAHTNSEPIYKAIPPEELGADWPASVQQKRSQTEKQERWRHSHEGNPHPWCCQQLCGGMVLRDHEQIYLP